MYEIIKATHNIVRWIVVLGGLFAIITSLQGLISRGSFSNMHKRAGIIFTSALNLQLIVGIILYVISPLIRGAMRNMEATMQTTQLRFFVVEHAILMFFAVVVAQGAYSLAKRAETDRAKFLRSSIGYGLAGLIIAFSIPWWRPLFPGL